MRNFLFALGALVLAGCTPQDNTSLTVHNAKTTATTVYVAFGSDSVVGVADWSFCTGSGLNCNFSVAAGTSKPLPNPNNAYVNATFSFDHAVGCGVTKAEVNVNNPDWYDTLDVSLVDGYSNKIEISVTPTKKPQVILGPPAGETGNEKVLGLFPFGCDICVERQNPPCGISKGKTGCKAGTQYDPDVPCQWQGPYKGGGGYATITLMP